jgi:hypothetical protein
MGPLETFGPGGLVPLAVITLIAATIAVCFVQRYERDVVFRLGRVRDGARGPGSTGVAAIQPAAVLPGTSPTVVLPRSRPESVLLE